MRVTQIGLYANNVEVASFALRKESIKSRYMVRQIIGMDADEITPKFYGFGLNGNSKFYDFGMTARELVIRLILNPTFLLNEEYTDIRDELYRAISATRQGKVEIRFYSGGVTMAKLDGFITKLESGYFNKSPEAQLTIRCDDPMFRGLTPVHLDPSDISTVNPLRVADSESTSPHGFTGRVTLTAAIPSFTIQDKATSPDWTFAIFPAGGFLVGDILNFSSDFKVRSLYLIRGGTTIHLLDKIQTGSVWPILFPGVTEFHFVNLGSFTWNYIEYHTAFWGV